MKKLTLLAAVSGLALGASAHASELELKITNINGLDETPKMDLGSDSIEHPDFRLLPIAQKDPFTHEPLPPIMQKMLVNNVIFAQERFVGVDHPRVAKFELNATAINEPAHVNPGPTPLPASFVVRVDITGGTLVSSQGTIRPGKTEAPGTVLTENSFNTSSTGFSTFVIGNANPDPDVGISLSVTQTDCTPITATVAIESNDFQGVVLHGPETITLSECGISQAGEIDAGVIKADFEEDFKGFLTADHEPVPHDDYARVGLTHVAIWNNLFDPKATGVTNRRIDVDDLAVPNAYQLQAQFDDLTGIDSVRLVPVDADGVSLGLDPVVVDLGSAFASDTAAAVEIPGATAGLSLANFDSVQAIRESGLVNFSVPLDTVAAAALSATEICGVEGDHPISVKCEENLYFALEVSAFGQKKKTAYVTRPDPDKGTVRVKEDNGNGVIAHQQITAIHRLNFATPCKGADGDTVGGTAASDQAFFFCTQDLGASVIGTIDGSGQNFGPFDWVNAVGNAPNFFRITHIPSIDGHGNPLTVLKGELTLKNSSGNGTTPGAAFDGTYKFALPIDQTVANRGRDGVYMMGSPLISSIVAAGTGGLGGFFGQSDISMTFFVNSVPGNARVGGPLESAFTEDFLPSEDHAFLGDLANYKLDVDRLIFSGGTFVPYGDNANDGVSLFTISGDDGRFGPKTPLKTKGFPGAIVDILGGL